MTEPEETPATAEAGSSDSQIEDVRVGQKLIIYAILLNVTVAIAAAYYPLLGVVQIVTLIVTILGLLRLFRGLGTAIWARVILIILMFVPLVNLVVLLMLNSRATKALREAGYKVGLMGASK